MWKWSRPNLMYYLNIFLEELTKTTTFSQGSPLWATIWKLNLPNMKHIYYPLNCNIQSNTRTKHLHVPMWKEINVFLSTNIFLTQYIMLSNVRASMKNKLQRCENKLCILKDLDTEKNHRKSHVILPTLQARNWTQDFNNAKQQY